MVVSSGDTVVVERVDVNDLGGTIVMRARDDGPGTFVELIVPVDVSD